MPSNQRQIVAVIVTALFSIGLVEGGGGSVWKDVLHQFGTTERTLGIGIAIGTLAAFPIFLFGGRLTSRFGAEKLLFAGCFLLVAVAAIVLGQTAIFSLVVLFLLRGLGMSLLDLGSNTIASDYERVSGARIMGFVHAGFSGGVAFGAIVAGLLYALDFGHKSIYVFLAVAYAAIGLFLRSRRHLLSELATVHNADGGASFSFAAFRTPLVRLSGGVLAIAFGSEIVVSQFAAAYIRDNQGSSRAISTLTVVVFSLSMMVGRLVIGWLARRHSIHQLFLIQGALVALGGLLIIATGSIAITLAGCLVVGFGIAGTAPLALSLAGDAAPGSTGEAIGAALFGGYIGGATLPLTTGLLVNAISFKVAILVVVAAGMALMWLANQIRYATAESRTIGATSSI